MHVYDLDGRHFRTFDMLDSGMEYLGDLEDRPQVHAIAVDAHHLYVTVGEGLASFRERSYRCGLAPRPRLLVMDLQGNHLQSICFPLRG